MIISEKLIEKYHQGLCTPEEVQAIELWLDSDEEPEFSFPEELVAKNEIKAEIWSDVHSHITSEKSKAGSFPIWNYAGSAAAVVLAFLGIFYFYSNQESSTGKSSTKLTSVHPSSLQTDALQIEFGAESGAVYSKENRVLDFCGVVKITPKENMKLSVTSLCDGNRETLKEINVVGGTTYFAMDLKNHNSSELVIMDKNLIGELPPLLQNSLIAQFGI